MRTPEQLERRILHAGSTASESTLAAAPVPDLVASEIVRSTLPAAVVSGTAASGTAKLDVSVQYGGVVTGKATFSVYTSSSETVDGSSVLVGKATRHIDVAQGRHVTIAVPLRIAAGAVPEGFYNLVAAVTDPSGTAVYTALRRTLNVAAPYVAWRENILKSTLPAPHGLVDLKVTNFGNVRSEGITTCALYATDDPMGTGAKVLIASVDVPFRIKPGKTGRVRIPYHSIPALSPGTHGTVVQLDDGPMFLIGADLTI